MRRPFPPLALSLLLLGSAHNYNLTLPGQPNGKRANAQEDNVAVSPCAHAVARRLVCDAANRRALEIMNTAHLEAVTAIQDVRTGALVAFAASQPSDLDVTSPIMPLSLAKLLLAASWWDNRQPDSTFENTKGTANARNPAYGTRVSVHDMLVGGSDSAGIKMAVALRKAVGTKKIATDFKHYGFGPRTNSLRDDKFWGDLAPTWETRLVPVPAYISLSEETKDAQWGEALSIGEANMSVTALHVSRFLQAIGNDGLMMTPTAATEHSSPAVMKSPVSRRQLNNSIRVMLKSTALRLQAALLDTVQRGTAKSIAQALGNTGWKIGGKTGSGTALLPKGAQIDGWFAGLIFDSQGKARYTFATFVRSGGYGGENAAKISAELARYMITGQ